MEKCTGRPDAAGAPPGDPPITRVAVAFPAAAYDSRTVIVVGCGHGGLTEITRVVEALGVRMVEESQPDARLTMEDGEFIAGVLDPQPEPGSPRFPGLYRRIGKIIARRNAAYRNWGWNDPSVDLYLDGVIFQVRNPLVLFVIRNALDVGLSQVAAGEQSFEAAFDQSLQRYLRCWASVSKLGLPTLFVSCERAFAAPRQFVLDVAEFLRLNPSPEQVDAAIGGLRVPRCGGGWQSSAPAATAAGCTAAAPARAEA